MINFKKESINIEFKRSFDRETIESVCAFANTHGGTVLIGVDDNGIPLDINIGKETLQQWINQVKQLTIPSLIPDSCIYTTQSTNRWNIQGSRTDWKVRFRD